MTKRAAIINLKKAIEDASYIVSKNCNCGFCKAARRIKKHLKAVHNYIDPARSKKDPSR